MHQPVFAVAAAWMTVLLATAIVSLVRSQSVAVRILLLDAVTLLLVAMLVLYSAAQRRPFYLDAALALALLSFVGTIAAARYFKDGQVFR